MTESLAVQLSWVRSGAPINSTTQLNSTENVQKLLKLLNQFSWVES